MTDLIWSLPRKKTQAFLMKGRLWALAQFPIMTFNRAPPVASMLPNLTPKPLFSLHVCPNLFKTEALNSLNIMAKAIKSNFDETYLQVFTDDGQSWVVGIMLLYFIFELCALHDFENKI